MRGLEGNGSFAAGGFAAMGNVTLDNVAVTGNYAASQLGIQGFDGLDNLSLNDVSLGGGDSHTGFGVSLFLSNVAEHSDTYLDLGNTGFLGSKTLTEGPDGLQTERPRETLPIWTWSQVSTATGLACMSMRLRPRSIRSSPRP